MARRKGKKLVTNLLIVGVVLLLVFTLGRTLNTAFGDFVLVSDDPNVIYDYSGYPQLSELRTGGGIKYCGPAPEFDQGKIQTTFSGPFNQQGAAAVTFFEPTTVMTEDNAYQFTTTNVRQARSVENDRTRSSGCGYLFYDVDVKQNGAIIDTIRFSQPGFCDEGSETTIVKEYGDLRATYGYRFQNIKTGCGGPFFAVMHKYEILNTSMPGASSGNDASAGSDSAYSTSPSSPSSPSTPSTSTPSTGDSSTPAQTTNGSPSGQPLSSGTTSSVGLLILSLVAAGLVITVGYLTWRRLRK